MGTLPRSIWNGTLRLRELVIPVGLAPTRTRGDPAFKLLHQGCGQPVQATRECPAHGKVPDEELVKGWEIAPGEYVLVEPGELAAVAPPDTRSIDLYAIVDQAALDQLLSTRAYWLVPGKTGGSRQGYAALEHALRTERLAALARYTGWGTEHIAAIRPAGPAGYVLALHELAPAGDQHDPGDIADQIAAIELPDLIAQLARKLLNRLEIPYEPALLQSRHRERVNQLLESKLKGDTIIRSPALDTTAPAPSSDITSALQESLRSTPRSRKTRRDQALANAQ